MSLDIRIPTGLLFAILGLILACFGVVSDRAIYQRSLGINVNLWWGVVLLGFGLVMLLLARRAGRRKTSGDSTQTANGG
jgi:protein-S-isoprenylcysteine O-methyltransferase Ste14